MGEHTPTPWFQDSSYVTDRGDGLIGRSIADCAKSPRIDRAEQIANAALIVKSVNNHEALVEALKLARARIEYLGVVCTDSKHFMANHDEFLPRIDAALNAAVGQAMPGGEK